MSWAVWNKSLYHSIESTCWFGWVFLGIPRSGIMRIIPNKNWLPELIINQPSTIIDHMLIHIWIPIFSWWKSHLTNQGLNEQPHRMAASFMAVMPRQSASRAACESSLWEISIYVTLYIRTYIHIYIYSNLVLWIHSGYIHVTCIYTYIYIYN